MMRPDYMDMLSENLGGPRAGNQMDPGDRMPTPMPLPPKGWRNGGNTGVVPPGPWDGARQMETPQTGGFDPVGPMGGLGGAQHFPSPTPFVNRPQDLGEIKDQFGPPPQPFNDSPDPHFQHPVDRMFGADGFRGGNTGIVPPGMGGEGHPNPNPMPTPVPMAQRPMFQRLRQMRQFMPGGFGGMNGGRLPSWQNAMGNSPQGRMDFLNKLKQSYNGGQGFQWNFGNNK